MSCKLTSDQANAMVAGNMGLARAAARRLAPGNAGEDDIEDLTQTGLLGMLRAARHYDSGRASLSTYLTAAAENEIKNHLGRACNRPLVSLSSPRLADPVIPVRSAAQPDDPGSHEIYRALDAAVDRKVLTPRERLILEQSSRMTIRAIADEHGVSKTRVQHIRDRSIERMRRFLASTEEFAF